MDQITRVNYSLNSGVSYGDERFLYAFSRIGEQLRQVVGGSHIVVHYVVNPTISRIELDKPLGVLTTPFPFSRSLMPFSPRLRDPILLSLSFKPFDNIWLVRPPGRFGHIACSAT